MTLKNTCFIWSRSSSSKGRSERNSCSTTMSRSSISGPTNRTASSTNELIFSGRSTGFEGRIACRNWVTIESSRVISARDIAIASSSSSLILPSSFRTLRSINWRWIWSELRGFPISCATPAASRVSALNRSDSIVFSVERRLSVISRRISA